MFRLLCRDKWRFYRPTRCVQIAPLLSAISSFKGAAKERIDIDDRSAPPRKMSSAQQPPSYDQAREDPYVSYPQVHGSNGPQAGNSSVSHQAWGNPSNPSAHPDNQQAAMQHRPELKEGKGFDEPGVAAALAQQSSTPQSNAGYIYPPAEGNKASPYVQTTPIPGGNKSPMESMLESLNKWGKKAEGMAENVWTYLKVGPSMTDTAWGKLSHGAKVLTEGGYENVFKQTFGAVPEEHLRKSYACYLSTSTGPVAGILYISTHKLAFCSDRPLSYSPTPGQQAVSYYKLSIPVDKVAAVTPSTNPQRPAEKYIQILTADGHEFWFMGFVNYDKAVKNLQAGAGALSRSS